MIPLRGTRISKKSRGGCASCKKLKIKCNEAKPSCEYCVATGRECIYPQQVKSLALYNGANSASKNEELSIAYDFLTKRQFSSVGSSYEQILNNATSSTLLKPFEMKLLKFFDAFCVDVLSFGVSKRAERIWRQEAPMYFFKSNLLRQAIFSFSSLILWPVSESRASAARQGRKVLDTSAHKSWDAVCKQFEQDPCLNNEKMFINLTSYFLNAVKEEISSISRLTDTTLSLEERKISAMGLRLSGGLLFAYLGMHSHGLMPLLDGMFKHDFLSICQGIAAHRDYCAEDFPQHVPKFTWPALDHGHEKVALITVLNRQVMDHYQKEPISSVQSDELGWCLTALDCLEVNIKASAKEKYPLPMFIWPLMIESRLIEKMRDFELMPLRLLYVYACLCHFTGFSIDGQKNIWINYAKWFKEFNFDLFGGWKYDLDGGLFGLIETKYHIRSCNMTDLTTLLPV